MHDDLVAQLREHALDYRLALAVLDPEYEEWRPEGEPNYRLDFIGEVPLLSFPVADEHGFWSGTCQVLATPSAEDAARAADAALRFGVNEVSVLGEAGFRALRPHTTAGRWFVVPQYGVSEGGLRPRFSAGVRGLTADDAEAVEQFCQSDSALSKFRSTQRDFGYRVQGLPVTCCGAFDGEDLVGFCSANPICRGVTEVSWLFVLPTHRRRGLASGLLSAQVRHAFARGDSVGYYAGWEATSPWLGAMVKNLGFRELLAQYRFIPADSGQEWRTWGLPMP